MPLISLKIHAYIGPAIRARLLAKLMQDRSCIVFAGTRNARGYGIMDVKLNGKRHPILAHRLAWVIANDRDLADGAIVCHRCNNPSCCNPRHLYEGTHKSNSADMVRAGRSPRGLLGVKGASHPCARYTEDQRQRALDMRAHRNSVTWISGQLGIPRQTISAWWTQYIKERSQRNCVK